MRVAVCLVIMVCGAFAQPAGTDETLRHALAAHQRRDYAEATRGYRQVLEKRPDLIQVRINLAAALAEIGQLDQVVAVLTEAPARDRDNPELRKDLALAYYRMDNIAAARAELEKLNAARPGNVAVGSLLADCYLRSGAASKALAVVEPLQKAQPNNPDLNYQLGRALVRVGRPAESLEPLERAGRLGRSADAYLLAGATALDLAQFQRAREDLENAVRINSKIPGAWTWTGMARDRVSDEEGAKQAYRAALEMNPGDFEANLHLGAILYRERDVPAAKPYLERAIAIQPSSSLALYAIALVRSAGGEVDQAVRDLESVTRASPDWVEPHVKLASLYFRLRRTDDGRRQQAIVDKLRAEHRDQKVPLQEFENQ